MPITPAPAGAGPVLLREPTEGRLRRSGSLRDVSPVLWRLRLREASFKNAAFHVETQGRVSGRRTVVHEYPKLDTPYAEDLGRHAVRYQITGYVIQRWPSRQGEQGHGNMFWNYDMARDTLIAALENEGPGRLIDPYNNRIGPQLFQCERYQVMETRERGGYAQFEMAFVEAGASTFTFVDIDPRFEVLATANSSMAAVADILDKEMAALNNPGMKQAPLSALSIRGPGGTEF